MAKKGILIGIGLLLIAAAVFISMRRSYMMSGSSTNAGGLTAVSADGTTIPWAGEKLPENTARQETNGLVVSLVLNPYPPTGSQASNFDVTLTDANGQPVTDANISLDLTMPSMYMPPNNFALEAGSGGNYQSSGRFTMRGQWRIEVIITRGSQKQSFFFDVSL